MLSERKQLIEEKSIKELTLELLKDKVDAKEMNLLAEKLDTNIKKILAEDKNELFKQHKLLAKRLFNFNMQLLQNHHELDEKEMQENMVKFTQENPEANEEIFKAMMSHWEAFHLLKKSGDEIFHFFQNIKNQKMQDTKALASFLEPCVFKYVGLETSKNIAAKVAKEFVKQFSAKKNYYQIREKILLFACEKLNDYFQSYDYTPDSQINILGMREDFAKRFDEYVGNIEKANEAISTPLTDHFMKGIEKVAPLFEESIDFMESIVADNVNDLEAEFIKKAETTLSEVISYYVEYNKCFSQLIAVAVRDKDHNVLLKCLRYQIEEKSKTETTVKALIETLYDRWSKDKDRELIAKLDIEEIKKSLLSWFNFEVAIKGLQGSLNLLAKHEVSKNSSAFFAKSESVARLQPEKDKKQDEQAFLSAAPF